MKHLVNRLTNMNIGGDVGALLTANEAVWIHELFNDNPRLLAGFENPDDHTIFKTMWHGEFPGKLLTGIAQTYLLRNDPKTREVGDRVVAALRDAQEPCGYLGPWPTETRFEWDVAAGGLGKWDTWGQYHCIYGLLRWYQVTGNTEAKEVAIRALDHIYDHFIAGNIPFPAQNWAECNMAIAHAFALFYEETGDGRYLEAAERIVHVDFGVPYSDFYSKTTLCCNWLNAALAGIPYHASGQPRWEGLYTLETFAVLHRVTGRELYRRAMDSLWWSMVSTDRHNTGSFGTGEGATGNPYGAGSETCNTVAWMAFSTDHLALSRDPRVADELELSFFNATLGSLLDGERNFTYMNDSDGTREAARITLEGHAYDGARDMSCCQANGNRGLTQVTEWALLTDERDLYLNYYGCSALSTRLDGGYVATVTEETVYPKDGVIRITVTTDCPSPLTLHLRIPAWSEHTTLRLNGEAMEPSAAGNYCAVTRLWQTSDVLELTLDMTPHFWIADADAPTVGGRVSAYRGPLLLAYKPQEAMGTDISFTMSALRGARVEDGEGLIRLTAPTTAGREVTLLDYSTAGKRGEPYVSWLRCEADIPPMEPDRNGKPIRCDR